MAGTQNYGRADYQVGDGAHHACGKEFPSCNGDFMPFGQARLVDIHLTHRAFMYIASLLVIALVVVALRRRPTPGIVRSAWLAAAVLAAQVLVGALNVWLDEYEALIVLHLALGHRAVGERRGPGLPALPGQGAGRGSQRRLAQRGGGRLMESRASRVPAAALRTAGLRQVVSDYVEMTKPKVQSLLLLHHGHHDVRGRRPHDRPRRAHLPRRLRCRRAAPAP